MVIIGEISTLSSEFFFLMVDKQKQHNHCHSNLEEWLPLNGFFGRITSISVSVSCEVLVGDLTLINILLNDFFDFLVIIIFGLFIIYKENSRLNLKYYLYGRFTHFGKHLGIHFWDSCHVTW